MNTLFAKLGPRKTRVFSIAFALLIVAGVEIALRAVESRLSPNIEHVKSIPEIVEKLAASSPNSLMIIGNSLANDGVSADELRQSAVDNGYVIGNVAKLVPDTTTIWSWYCIQQNHIATQKDAPPTVLIAFGWDQLSDQSRILPTGLGAFFCSTEALIDLHNRRFLDSMIMGEFLLAKTSRLFAHREPIRNRVLSATVPNYRSITQQINRGQNLRPAQHTRQLTYSVLDSMVRSLQRNGSSVIVVAMPVLGNPYEIRSGLVGALSELNVPLLDYRNVVPISQDMFLDEMHLNSKGASILSKRLGKDLSPQIGSSGEGV